LCPGCLRPEPEASSRLRSERGRLKSFYVVYIKWEYLWVTVPFCKECADRRGRWEKLDMALLFVAVIVSFALAVWFAVSLKLQPWEFWVIFLAVAAILTVLCNRLVRDYRAVRIKHYDDNTLAFVFSRPEYAQEFGRLNGQPALVLGSRS
jgi:hypothetical protein